MWFALTLAACSPAPIVVGGQEGADSGTDAMASETATDVLSESPADSVPEADGSTDANHAGFDCHATSECPASNPATKCCAVTGTPFADGSAPVKRTYCLDSCDPIGGMPTTLGCRTYEDCDAGDRCCPDGAGGAYNYCASKCAN